MFFNSNKGMIRLLSKGISNIYFKVTIEEKNCRSQTSIFFLLQLKNHRSGYM